MTAIDAGTFVDVDRLIDAVAVTEQSDDERLALLVEFKRYSQAHHASTGYWSRIRRRHTRDALRDQLVEALAARAEAQKEREVALRALAAAALERLRADSVDSVLDRLDERVEEVEESRQQAAQVEGEREPDDPYTILHLLPAGYHENFESDYRDALRAAYPAEGYLALRRMLKRWRKAAEALSDPAYQAEAEKSRIAIETGDFTGYASMDEVFEI